MSSRSKSKKKKKNLNAFRPSKPSEKDWVKSEPWLLEKWVTYRKSRPCGRTRSPLTTCGTHTLRKLYEAAPLSYIVLRIGLHLSSLWWPEQYLSKNLNQYRWHLWILSRPSKLKKPNQLKMLLQRGKLSTSKCLKRQKKTQTAIMKTMTVNTDCLNDWCK